MTRLVIGQVNLLEYVGSGTMVDVESSTPGRQIEVSRFSYAVALQIPASRLDFEVANAPRTIRVVKKDRAWNDEAARKQLLVVFEAAGQMSEIARNGRRRLSAILFS